MKLLTEEIKHRLPRLYSQENAGAAAIVVVKFFCPWTSATWYITEGEERDGDVLLFGLCCIHEDELGYVSLNEMRAIRGPGGLTIERDLHWRPTTLAEVRKSRAEGRPL